MKEKSELHPIESLPQESGKDHEMIVMNPNEIVIRIDNLKNLISENLVHRNIRLEQNAIEPSRGQWEKRMEERPEVVLAEPMIESRIQIPREEDRHRIKGLEKSLGNLFLVRNGDFFTEAANEGEFHG